MKCQKILGPGSGKGRSHFSGGACENCGLSVTKMPEGQCNLQGELSTSINSRTPRNNFWRGERGVCSKISHLGKQALRVLFTWYLYLGHKKNPLRFSLANWSVAARLTGMPPGGGALQHPRPVDGRPPRQVGERLREATRSRSRWIEIESCGGGVQARLQCCEAAVKGLRALMPS